MSIEENIEKMQQDIALIYALLREMQRETNPRIMNTRDAAREAGYPSPAALYMAAKRCDAIKDCRVGSRRWDVRRLIETRGQREKQRTALHEGTMGAIDHYRSVEARRIMKGSDVICPCGVCFKRGEGCGAFCSVKCRSIYEHCRRRKGVPIEAAIAQVAIAILAADA